MVLGQFSGGFPAGSFFLLPLQKYRFFGNSKLGNLEDSMFTMSPDTSPTSLRIVDL